MNYFFLPSSFDQRPRSATATAKTAQARAVCWLKPLNVGRLLEAFPTNLSNKTCKFSIRTPFKVLCSLRRNCHKDYRLSDLRQNTRNITYYRLSVKNTLPLKCWEQDSNLRSREASDLQSDVFDRSTIPAMFIY